MQAFIRSRHASISRHIVLIIAVMLMCVPLCYAVVISTQTAAETLNSPLSLGSGFVINFEYVLGRNIGRFMLNSIAVSLIVALVKTVLSLGAGLAFVFFDFRGKWLVFWILLFTLMIPEDVLTIAQYRLISGTLGLGDTLMGLVLPSLASAYGTFLFFQHFSTLPSELSEAAQLDGMNPVQFLVHILIPLSRNMLGAFFVVVFNGSWNMYLWPIMVITDSENQVIQAGIRMIRGTGESSQQYGPLMMGAILASIPPLLVFLALQQQVIEGFAFVRDHDPTETNGESVRPGMS